MSYKYLTQHDAVCFARGRGGRAVRFIVIHHWDDPAKNPTFEGTVSWFKNPNSWVSAHYVVEAGRVACMVNESDTAWHAGDGEVNLASIGIECNPRASQGDLQTLVELLADLKRRYPHAQIIGHKDVVSTGCPGRYYDRMEELRRGALTARPSNPAPKHTAPAPLIVDGVAGRLTIRRLQEILGTTVDGSISSQWSGSREHWTAAGDGWEWVENAQGSLAIAALQQRLGGLVVDGHAGEKTVRRLQERLGVTVDGYAGAQTIRALQTRLNQGKI